MMKFLSLIPIVFLVLMSACSKAPEVRFGMIEGADVSVTDKIEYEVGNEYGYSVKFPVRMGMVTIKEEFTLPGPAQWQYASGSPSQKTAPDGSVMTRTINMDTNAKTGFRQTYKIIEGDPKGPHTIRLWINDEPLKTINFTIQ